MVDVDSWWMVGVKAVSVFDKVCDAGVSDAFLRTVLRVQKEEKL